MGNSEGDPGQLLQTAATAPQPDNWIIWAGPGSILLLVLCSAFFAYAARYFAASSSAKNENAIARRLAETPVLVQTSVYLFQLLLIATIVSLSIFYTGYIWRNYNFSQVLYALPAAIGALYLGVWLMFSKIFSSAAEAGLSNFSIYSLFFISRVFYFLAWPLEKWLKPENTEDAGKDHMSIKDFLVQNTVSPNPAEEKRILRGIMNFSNIYVRQIMVPRTDVVAHDIKTPFSKLCRSINENRYSRVPVYDGSFDSIKGILYVKDLLPYLNQNADFNWQSLLREPYFVPETKKIDQLLQEFRRKKVHLAIVVDEYGGTSGIVTLEDILEEIVGEIHDEFDEEEVNYSRLDSENYVFDGKTPLADVVRIMDLDAGVFEEARGDAETIGGLLIEISGSIPQAGQKLNFNDFSFTVETADGRRVRRVKISRLQNSPTHQQQ